MTRANRSNETTRGGEGEPRYTLEIKWSDEDNCFVVLAPACDERYMMPVASGKTYEEAARAQRDREDDRVRQRAR